jgi:hypothetical protein
VRKLLVVSVCLGMLAFTSEAAAGHDALKIQPKNHVKFGKQPLGSTTSKSVTVTNTSDDPATINGFGVSSDVGSFALDFGSITCGGTLAPGESCSYDITFTPTVLGWNTGQSDICATGSCPVFLTLVGRGI